MPDYTLTKTSGVGFVLHHAAYFVTGATCGWYGVVFLKRFIFPQIRTVLAASRARQHVKSKLFASSPSLPLFVAAMRV